MKKLLLIVIMFTMFASVVTAASINGDYKGKSIVILKSNGQVLTVEDAPAVIMDSRTMVPISMLRQIGLGVEWNAEEYSVDVTVNQSAIAFDPIRSTKDIISYGGSGLTLVDIEGEITAVTYFYSKGGYDADWTTIDKVFNTMIDFGATYSRVVYVEGQNENILEIKTQILKDFLDGKITQDELSDSWILTGYLFDNANTPQSNINVEPVDNTAMCSAINKKYDDLIRATEESLGSSGFGRSSRMEDQLNGIEENRVNELTLYGCPQ